MPFVDVIFDNFQNVSIPAKNCYLNLDFARNNFKSSSATLQVDDQIDK